MEIIEGLRVGRLTALQKPDGGVEGIVVRFCAPFGRKNYGEASCEASQESQSKYVSALLTSCKVSRMWTATRPLCPLTGSGRAI